MFISCLKSSGDAEEMEEVVGKLEDNTFIRQQEDELKQFKETIERINNNF